ncbi:hypothetical protein GGH95_002421 [Coemansia sp. RSA 1836]|nr:hypothetical protein GGH95_002421 [Coemansia sp. RSA 1836]
MKVSLIAAISSLALTAYSQVYVSGVVTMEDYDAKVGWQTKSILPPYKYTNVPVVDVQSTDLICRSSDLTFKGEPYKVNAGGHLYLNWDTKSVSGATGKAPVGPCSFWLAKQSTKGVGAVWSKIDQYTIGDKKEWCSAHIINGSGTYDLTLPSDIAPGVYILRSELIDVSDAADSNYDDFTSGARYHSSCVVLDIASKGTSELKNPVDIIKAYKKYYKAPLMPKTVEPSKFVYPGPALDAPAKV